MRSVLLLVLVASCSESSSPAGDLATEEQALLGCWEGQQGIKTVQYRFHEDHSVETRVVNGTGTWYSGTFAVVGDALTYDFGEEPPTYHIDVTSTTFSYRELPFTFRRMTCD